MLLRAFVVVGCTVLMLTLILAAAWLALFAWDIYRRLTR